MDLNYRKWDNIEVSDDEDDTHPNIDTPSLFRWRHQARVERMEEQEKEKKDFEQKKSMHQDKVKKLQDSLQNSESQEKEKDRLLKEMEKLKAEKENIKKHEVELKKKEKLTPWNVDTISQPGFEKTIISKPKPKIEETEEDKAKKTLSFVDKYEKEIKKFGMLRDYTASRDCLRDSPHLVCDETAQFLTLWCVNLEVQQKSALMERVAHQVIVMQYILELAKQLDRDPRSCVPGFFERMKTAQTQYLDAFKDELTSFIDRIRVRAQGKIEAAMRELEEEERHKRMGPGGLDPLEVLPQLPAELRECFESKSVAKLHEVAASMEKEKFDQYIKLCVDSGLWVADAKAQGLTPASIQLEKEMSDMTVQVEEPSQQEPSPEEDVYEEVD